LKAWDAQKKMSTTALQKPKLISTAKNYGTLKKCTNKELSSRQYAHDDSRADPTRVFPFECFVSGERYLRGSVCAGSEESAQLIAEARHPEACKVKVGPGCHYLVAR